MKENSVQNNSPKNVGVWIRVSSEDQARGESPEHHRQRARDFTANRKWTIKEVYDLSGVFRQVRH